MSQKETVKALRKLGWRIRRTGELRQAIKHFQQGWALGAKLKDDGVAGPKTEAALKKSLDNLKAGKGTASTHFSFSEFACRCNGKFSACARIWIQRELIESLEDLRAKYYKNGLSVDSGCRCNGHNEEVGGATSSQHKYGTACDVDPVVNRNTLAKAKMFAGIGYNLSSGEVSHVDRRDEGPNNTTHASVQRPTVWVYHR